MKFKNTILFATLLFSLNVLFFYISKMTKRRPSSISSSEPTTNAYRFSYQNTQKFLEQNTKNLKINMLNGFHWKNENKTIGLSFNNPLIENQNQEAVLWCQLFPNVEILLTAQKVSVNGEHPSILATMSCPQSSSDKIDFNLELSNIFRFQPKDQSLQVENTRMELRNFDESWPQDWMVKSIKFYNQSLEGITISNYELYSFLGYQLEIKNN